MKIIYFIFSFVFVSPIYSMSLFDEMIAENNGKVPTPIYQFYEVLNDFVSKKTLNHPFYRQQVVFDLIPLGRSRQKSFANFKNPRVLISSGPSYPRMFIGYAKESDELEAITWNEDNGQFDFQIVKNYSSNAQTISGDISNRCIVCHQGKIPIYSKTPWSESLNPDADNMYHGSLKSTSLLNEVRKHHPKENYLGFNFSRYGKIHSSPLNFDLSVRKAAELQRNSNVIRKIENRVNAPRKLLLLETYNRIKSNSYPSIKKRKEIIQVLKKNSLDKITTIASSVLPNRNPLIDPTFSTTALVYPLSLSSYQYEMGFRDFTYDEKTVDYTFHTVNYFPVQSLTFGMPSTKRPQFSFLMIGIDEGVSMGELKPTFFEYLIDYFGLVESIARIKECSEKNFTQVLESMEKDGSFENDKWKKDVFIIDLNEKLSSNNC